ncbi:hypothetical protein H0H92_004385 [Tricholoma furcatifolium]|nr:hypothetical protein H0H92_004385 [Tricholoma furcatifolium]
MDSEEDTDDNVGKLSVKRHVQYVKEEKKKTKPDVKKVEKGKDNATIADLTRQLQELKIFLGEAIQGTGFQLHPLPPPPSNLSLNADGNDTSGRDNMGASVSERGRKKHVEANLKGKERIEGRDLPPHMTVKGKREEQKYDLMEGQETKKGDEE